MDSNDKQIKRRLNAIIVLLCVLTFLIALFICRYGYMWFNWFH